MKKIVICLLSGFMLFLGQSNIKATEKNRMVEENNPYYYAERINELGSIEPVIVPKTLKSEKLVIEPLIEYSNQERALNTFKEKFKEEIQLLMSSYNLLELSNSTFVSYYELIRNLYEDEIFLYSISNEMMAFFDIYENKGQNEFMRVNMQAYDQVESQVYLERIDAVAPSYGEVNKPLSNSMQQFKKISITRSIALPNLVAAQNYAKKYAVNPNPSYYLWSSDCTNFVSQILYAGGVSQVYTANIYSGWWYRGKDSVSVSWINADTFSRYMGRTAYGSWASLSSYTSDGSFIAADFKGDGVVDHMAFVVTRATVGSLIAQHTTNYLEWSYNTGWMTNPPGQIYYHVR